MTYLRLLKSTAFAAMVSIGVGVVPARVEAQSIGERIRRAAEEARKVAEAKKKAEDEQRRREEEEQRRRQQTPASPATPGGGNPQAQSPNSATPASPQRGRGQQNTGSTLANQKPSTAKVEAIELAPYGSRELEHLAISPRGSQSHFAAPIQRGSRWVVTYDGTDGPRFDEIVNNRVRFSLDGTRYAYVGRAGEEYALVVDGKEVVRIPRANTQFSVQPNFTANNRHVYFALKHGGSGRNEDNYCQIVVDGQPGQKSFGGGDVICKPTWSPDGDHYAMVIRPIATPPPSNSGIPQTLIVDGKPAGYPGQGFTLNGDPNGDDLKFTADGKHLYVKTMQLTPGQPASTVMFMDGKPWVKAATIGLYVPPVGDRVVAVIGVQQPGAALRSFLQVDNKAVPGDCAAAKVQFSPDGKHYAAVCQNGIKGHALMVDGKKGQEYDAIERVEFAPDSTKVAYVARSGRQVFVVVGDQESEGYNRVIGLWFGGSGKRIAYTAQTERSECRVVVDGKPNAMPACPAEVIFSPDGSRYAYTTDPLKGGALVIDGTTVINGVSPFAGRPEANVIMSGQRLGAVFSPDNKHLAYLVNVPSDNSRVMLVIDDKQFPLPSREVYLPTFTPDNRHFIFAVAGGSGFPLAQEITVHVDGHPAATFAGARQGFPWQISYAEGDDPNYDVTRQQKEGAAWNVAPDGILTFLITDGLQMPVVKRVTVTLPSDTSIDTMVSEGRPVGNR